MKTERPLCEVCRRVLPADILVGFSAGLRVAVCSCPCAEKERRELAWKPMERRLFVELPPLKTGSA